MLPSSEGVKRAAFQRAAIFFPRAPTPPKPANRKGTCRVHRLCWNPRCVLPCSAAPAGPGAKTAHHVCLVCAKTSAHKCLRSRVFLRSTPNHQFAQEICGFSTRYPPLSQRESHKAAAVEPGFGPESRDVGGAEARRGVGSADSVRIATELSGRSASCSERRRPFAFGLDAVAALHIRAIHTANGTIYRARAGGRVALDIVKNPLCWSLPKCRQSPPSAPCGRRCSLPRARP
jgi:hypothetical protein